MFLVQLTKHTSISRSKTVTQNLVSLFFLKVIRNVGMFILFYRQLLVLSIIWEKKCFNIRYLANFVYQDYFMSLALPKYLYLRVDDHAIFISFQAGNLESLSLLIFFLHSRYRILPFKGLNSVVWVRDSDFLKPLKYLYPIH